MSPTLSQEQLTRFKQEEQGQIISQFQTHFEMENDNEFQALRANEQLNVPASNYTHYNYETRQVNPSTESDLNQFLNSHTYNAESKSIQGI
jgi:hypothetical protein